MLLNFNTNFGKVAENGGVVVCRLYISTCARSGRGEHSFKRRPTREPSWRKRSWAGWMECLEALLSEILGPRASFPTSLPHLQGNHFSVFPPQCLSMGFSRQEYWSGLPVSSPGDLPDPGMEPGSSTLQADSLPSKPPGKPHQA